MKKIDKSKLKFFCIECKKPATAWDYGPVPGGGRLYYCDEHKRETTYRVLKPGNPHLEL